MSDIFNKYIFTYIYIICLLHFVVNKEYDEKLVLRYNGEEKEFEWEFKLFLDTEGGQEFYNRLKRKTNIKLYFSYNSYILDCQYNDNFPSL